MSGPEVRALLRSKPDPDGKPIYSMTGFARVSSRASDSFTFSLTLKSVNHRFLDLQLRMPSGTEPLEMRVRRFFKERVVRGHLDFALVWERGIEKAVQYNGALLRSYLTAFQEAAVEQGLEDQEPDLNAILRLPNLFAREAVSFEDDSGVLEEAVLCQLDSLLAGLNEMREREGAALAAELHLRLDSLSILIHEVFALRETAQAAYLERLTARLTTLLSGSFDRDRVLQEAALLAERSDVDEELVRLRGHVAHFRSLLEAGGEIGKKGDFLLQEMNREANTLLSKTAGIAGNAARITEFGLEMKTLIEKAREQVQNLE